VKSKLQKIINHFNKKFILSHLVWDFDGTLYQSELVGKKLDKAYFDYINHHQATTQKQIDHLLNQHGKLSKVANHLLDKSEEQILKEVDSIFIPSSILEKDLEMVSRIEEMTQFQHLILSNSTLEAVKTGLRKIGFKKRAELEFYPFTKIISRDQLKYSKPHFSAFQAVVNHTKQPKIKHLMIGDSLEDDIYPSKKFGMQSIHVSRIDQFFS
jgi:FMN phosphatase YigB (HAD superfamily)